jgi:hypothetical protein
MTSIIGHIKKWWAKVHQPRAIEVKNWGVVYINNLPFFSTVYVYSRYRIKIRLVGKYNNTIYTYRFSSRQCIIDDEMIFIQQRNNKQTILAHGYICETDTRID